MGRVRIIAASAVFLLVTLLKLASPALASELRSGLLPELDRQIDYRTAAETVGRSISERNNALIAVLREYGETSEYSAETDPPAPTERVAPPMATFAFPAEATPDVSPPSAVSEEAFVPETEGEPPAESTEQPVTTQEPVEAEPDDSEQPAAVAAFLESLEAYPDRSLPANVSWSMPAIPFEFVGPVGGYNASGFGFRTHPVYGDVRFHYGTDLAAGSGEDIYAFGEGTVVLAGEYGSYGLCVVISHPDGWQTLYGHCSKICVENGDSVEAGQLIALVGETGNATGPHLHFELTCDAVYYNPEYYIA